jgi:alkanesulfonate monooxygenase SsuD/methylene tetrahydromethanopterin reductase-like flavin-dependent oxidoreductase (luciferase family)
MTTPKLSFGFTLPQRGVFFGVTTVEQLLTLSSDVDTNPMFDSLWVGDSLLAKPRPDSIALLGALCAATRRVTLGVGCMASFPVRDPVIFAYQWATLDLLSGGRMLLAACTGIVAGGASAREGALWGVADRERAARLAENIDICRRLWSETGVSFTGRFHSIQNVTIEPRPVQQPCPIWIASNPRPSGVKPEIVDGALRRVAQKADGWMTVEMFPRMFASNWTKVCGFLGEAGRDAARFPNMLYHNVNINPDRQAGLEESKRFLDKYYGPVFTPPMVEAWTAAGDASRCVDDLRRYADQGVQCITLRITGWQQAEQYKRLVNDVLPKV